MIIFYNKTDGKIVGTLEGRVHSPVQLNMGPLDENGKMYNKLIVEWKPTGEEHIDIVEEDIWEDFTDDEGFTEQRKIGTRKRKIVSQIFEPDTPQKDVFMALERGQKSIYDFRVDTKTKTLVEK